MSLADRRTVLVTAVSGVLCGWPFPAPAASVVSWRRAEFETRIRPPASIAALRVGTSVPLSLVSGEHRLEGVRIMSNADRIDRGNQDRGLVVAEWAPGAVEPRLDIVWLVSIRAEPPEPLSDAEPWIDAASGRHPLAGRRWRKRWTML